jgi:hypothetical protein
MICAHEPPERERQTHKATTGRRPDADLDPKGRANPKEGAGRPLESAQHPPATPQRATGSRAAGHRDPRRGRRRAAWHTPAVRHRRAVRHPRAACYLQAVRRPRAVRHPQAIHPQAAFYPPAVRHPRAAWRPRAVHHPQAVCHPPAIHHPPAVRRPPTVYHLQTIRHLPAVHPQAPFAQIDRAAGAPSGLRGGGGDRAGPFGAAAERRRAGDLRGGALG